MPLQLSQLLSGYRTAAIRTAQHIHKCGPDSIGKPSIFTSATTAAANCVSASSIAADDNNGSAESDVATATTIDSVAAATTSSAAASPATSIDPNQKGTNSNGRRESECS